MSFAPAGEIHTGATWSADGETLYFAVLAAGAVRVARVPASGGRVTDLGPVGWRTAGMEPVVLGDGRLCALVPQPFDTFLAFDPETGETERLIESPEGETVSTLAVSPDGRTIAYRRANASYDPERLGIWVCDLETRKERRISPLDVHACGFSADGSAVIARDWRAEPFSVWRLPLDGTEAQRLGTLPFPSKSLATVRCTHDGESLVLVVGDGTLELWLAEDWDPARPPR